MKKIIMLVIGLCLLISCGKKYETYTYMRKEKMYKDAINKPEEMKKIEKMIEVLKKEAENGDSTAEKEYSDWHTIQLFDNRDSYYDPNVKANMLNRKW